LMDDNVGTQGLIPHHLQRSKNYSLAQLVYCFSFIYYQN